MPALFNSMSILPNAARISATIAEAEASRPTSRAISSMRGAGHPLADRRGDLRQRLRVDVDQRDSGALRGEGCPEPIPPEPHRFMRNADAAFVEPTLHIPQRARIANAHHDRQAYELGRGLKVSEDARICHRIDLPALPGLAKPIFL
jgi:hypothetical protein